MRLQELAEKWKTQAVRLRKYRERKPKELSVMEQRALIEHAQVLELCAKELMLVSGEES